MLDFENLETPQDAGLMEKSIKLAQEALELEQQVNEYQETIDALKARIREITDRELPEMMSEGGIENFTLSDGRKVSLKDVVAATMPKDDDARKAVFAWLCANNAEDIIKTEVKAKFGKSGHNEALNLAGRLSDEGYDVDCKEDVHYQTLNSHIRQIIERGDALPPETILPVYMGKQAKFANGKK